MSTRSNITFKRKDGIYQTVYCHYDGYPEGVGQCLIEHYNTDARAEAITRHGDISVLEELIVKPEGHCFDKAAKGCTVFYGRDRGEVDVATRELESFEDLRQEWKNSWCEYSYIRVHGEWYFNGGGCPSKNRELVKEYLLAKESND